MRFGTPLLNRYRSPKSLPSHGFVWVPCSRSKPTFNAWDPVTYETEVCPCQMAGATCRAIVPGAPLLLEEAGDLVALGRLPGDPRVRALLDDRKEALAAEVRLVGPRVRIPRVLVLERARYVVLVGLEARRAVEPKLVLHDRAAPRRVDVVRPLQGVRRPEPPVDQLLRQVGSLERRVRA